MLKARKELNNENLLNKVSELIRKNNNRGQLINSKDVYMLIGETARGNIELSRFISQEVNKSNTEVVKRKLIEAINSLEVKGESPTLQKIYKNQGYGIEE
jgi:hypothetical protein